jgi:hypothetical protein
MTVGVGKAAIGEVRVGVGGGGSRGFAPKRGFRGDENLLIDRTGNVFNPYTRERIGTFDEGRVSVSGRQRLGTLFAVVRVDGEGVSESQVTVKEVVSTEEEAIAEVERLNALRPDDSCRYVWQATRHVAPGD